jgi:integrase
MSKNRRPHFDTADYQKLTNHMRRNEWRKHKHPRIARDRALLREYVLIMANTGMRVGEQRKLKWKDVQRRTDDNGNDMLLCAIEGKTGKRLVACNEGTEKYFDRVKVITSHTKPDDWIWAKQDGTLKEEFGVGYLHGKTPRQAAKTKKGRAQVINWLKKLENSEARRAASEGQEPYDFQWMWREMKIDDARR